MLANKCFENVWTSAFGMWHHCGCPLTSSTLAWGFFLFFWEAGLSIVGPGTWFLPLEHLARLWQYRSSGLYLQIYVIRLPSGGIQEPAFFTSCQVCCNLKTSIEDHHYVCDSMEVYTFLKRLFYHMKNTSRDLVIARVTFLPREWASAFSPYSEYYY